MSSHRSSVYENLNQRLNRSWEAGYKDGNCLEKKKKKDPTSGCEMNEVAK